MNAQQRDVLTQHCHPCGDWPYLYGNEDSSDNAAGGPLEGVEITLEEIMLVYDLLPLKIRRALCRAAHAWAPTWCCSKLVRNRWSVEQVIKRLAQADKRLHDRRLADLQQGVG